MSRAKKVATAAGGLLAAAAVLAPAANAETYVVNSTADNGDGTCDTTCTLRDAIENANDHVNSPTSTPDVINFADDVRGTIQLTGGNDFSTLQIVNDGVHINGPGADQLKIVGDQDRVFKLFGFGTTPADDYDVTISGLELTGGAPTSSSGDNGGGGAILSTNSGEKNYDPFFVRCGDFAALTLKGVYIHGNTTAEDGGGVDVQRNPCRDKAAPSTTEASLNVIDSTIASNHAGFEGGGVSMQPGTGSLFVSNATISGNDTAEGPGGGIAIDTRVPSKIPDGNTYDVDNSTITGNTTGDAGGGIFTTRNMGLRSTIVFGNKADQPVVSKAIVSDDIVSSGGTYTIGYSDIGVRTGATVTDTPGEPNLSSDPQLGTLQNNGGPTPTELPPTTSPAIDSGISNGLTSDQRGLPRTVDRQPANAADGTDIGAVEVPADPPTPTPTPEPEPEPTPLPGPAPQFCLGKQVILTKGGDADEKLAGTSTDDGIIAGGGQDLLQGLSGDDCLFGQTGNDKVQGGPGNDNANGDRDDDTVKGDDGDDSVRGQNGNDRVFGGAGDDPKVTGGAGDDTVKGGAGDDFLKGDGGNDSLVPGGGEDFVHAGGGADTINAADGAKDHIICGTGKDVANVDPIDDVDKDCNTVNVIQGPHQRLKGW